MLELILQKDGFKCGIFKKKNLVIDIPYQVGYIVLMKREFIYFPKFEKLWKELGLDDDELRDLETVILEDPKSAPVIPGTNGLRKLRWSRHGMGKRGGIRIFYVDFEDQGKTYMIYIIQKNEKENLTSSDKKEINNLISIIKKDI